MGFYVRVVWDNLFGETLAVEECYFYCTLIVVLSWPGRWQVTAETCSQILPNCNYCILFDVCYVLTVHNMLYKFDNAQRDGLSQIHVFKICEIS